MGKVESFLTNFDFELSLEKSSFSRPSYNKYTKSLEFIFLWVADKEKSLYSEINYDREFLHYISTKRGFLPKINKDQFNSLWWGDISSTAKWIHEREINSKETSLKCRRELGISLRDSGVVENNESLALLKIPFILKSFFGFSGKGITFVKNEDQIKKINIDSSMIYEPVLNRVRDFGVSYLEGESRIIQNLIDERGQFKGALIKDKFPEEELILSKTIPIYNWYQNEFNIDSLQIDCFQYLEDGQLKFNELCEVNHRRTMGIVASDLHRSYGGDSSAMLLVSPKKMKSFENYADRIEALSTLDFRGSSGVLTLSTLDAPIQVFFLSEKSDRGLQQLIVSWWKAIRKDSETSLPREFIINT